MSTVSPDEMIDAMSLSHSGETLHDRGHISNKTFYIALNYQEYTDQINYETRKEIIDRLAELEDEQERLVYYVALLNNKQQETVIRRFYFEGHTWSEVARELHIAIRTAHKIKSRALDRLAAMYSFTDGSHS